MNPPILKESQRHSTAFAYYLQLGGERSYAKVAVKFGFSETSVRKWAQSFSWKDRVAEADAKANAQQQSQAEESYVRTVEDFRNLKDELFRTLKGRVDSGQCSVMELIYTLRAVKTELGEPWQITAAQQPQDHQNPFEGILRAMFPADNQAVTQNLQ